MNIKEICAEYGANNIRLFITQDTGQNGFFRDPFDGRHEYRIVEDNDKVADGYKITVELADASYTHLGSEYDAAPDWWKTSFNQKRYYIMDLNHISGVEVYVLVDEDNKYERIA